MSLAPPERSPSRSRRTRIITWALLVTLLLVHFATRRNADTGVLSANHYPDTYRLSLNLVAGHGFTRSALPDEPEAAPLRKFFAMERPALTEAEVARYFAQPYAVPVARSGEPPAGVSLSTEERLKLSFLDSHGSTRTLDVWAVAGLWKVFGVEWRVVAVFHALLSTLTSFFVFSLTREAAGTKAAFAATALLLFTPLENDYAASCPRDISPLWFATFALWSVVRVAGRFRSPVANVASFAACGAAATLGVGWRVDPLLVGPAAAALLIALLRSRGWSARGVTGAVACYALGAWLLLAAIPALGPTRVKLSATQQGFAMGYYANAARCNLFRIENSFQVVRCDIQFVIATRHYADTHGVPGGARPNLSESFFRSGALLFRDTFTHDAYTWVRSFPSLCVRALAATHLVDLPIWRNDFPERRTAADRVVPRELGARGAVALALVGLLAAACLLARPWVALVLATLWAYDTAALLVVLPEYKHTGILILPKCVLGAIGLSALARLVSNQLRWPTRRRLTIVVVTSAALATAWLLACGAAAVHSRSARADLVEAVERASSSATPDPGAVVSPRRLSVRRSPGDQPDPIGYLVTVRTGAAGGLLRCRQVRWHRDNTERATVWGQLTRVFETSHPLEAARLHRFFVTCLQGWRQGDQRPYACHVLVDGDASIESAQRVDLSAWKGPLVSTLLQDSAGSPRLGRRAVSLMFDPSLIDEDGLMPGER